MKPLNKKWKAPRAIDRECLALCRAINEHTRLETIESCCGHGTQPYRIFFIAHLIPDLLPLLYWADKCHSGAKGFKVIAYTDCAGHSVRWMLEGPLQVADPNEVYRDAERIAACLRKESVR